MLNGFTGKTLTDAVRVSLKEAEQTGKYLYVQPVVPGTNPTRIIRVRTERCTTIATTIQGGEIPLNKHSRLYIQ